MLTLNSPHLGIRKPQGGVTKKIWRGLVHTAVGTIGLFGVSGQELALADEQQILFKMATPGNGYLEALSRFKSAILVGILDCDIQVPYATSMIRWHCPHMNIAKQKGPAWRIIYERGFREDGASLFGKHAAITDSETNNGSLGTRPPEATEELTPGDSMHQFIDSRGEVQFDLRMLQGLQSAAEWKRVEIKFTPSNPLAALNGHTFLIQKHQWNPGMAGEAVAMLGELVGREQLAADQ
jgi:hypothetical protein